MKKIVTFLTTVIFTATIWAQSPERMSYQAVIRDASENLVTNQAVSMQISILQGSESGTAVYVEIQTPTTNNNGLVSIEIGSGTLVDGDFSTIDWSVGPYFLKTETDLNGGMNYTITGTSQLLSVPYALHAKTAESVTGTILETDPFYASDSSFLKAGVASWDTSIARGIKSKDTANWNNKVDTLIAGTGIRIVGDTISATADHYVGEYYGGGIVFWVDHTGEHGLILSMVDLSTSQAWSDVTNTLIGTTNDWDGATNTAEIIGQSGHTSSAAKLCADYTNADYGTGIFSDWYLPGIAELNHIWNNYYEVQKALANDGNVLTTPLERELYWSSSEGDVGSAWAFLFGHGSAYAYDQSSTYYVRAVRAF